jgi:hypothetical protein
MTVLSADWLSQHGAHTLTLVGPVLLISLVALGADARAWLDKRGRPLPAPATVIAAVLSALAAVVHAVVCPEHFREGLLYGQFFAVAASAQLTWAGLVILRPRRWVLTAGVLGNLAILTLWAITRTAGIPFGPEAGEIEAVGALDVIATVFEAAIVICCASALMSDIRRGPNVDVAGQSATPTSGSTGASMQGSTP